MVWLSHTYNAASSFLQSLMATSQANASAHLHVLDDKSHHHRRFFLEECDKDIGDDNERSIEGKFVRHIFMPAPADAHILPFEEVGVNQQQERVAADSPLQGRNLGYHTAGNAQ